VYTKTCFNTIRNGLELKFVLNDNEQKKQMRGEYNPKSCFRKIRNNLSLRFVLNDNEQIKR
jgi:hypothetical protein